MVQRDSVVTQPVSLSRISEIESALGEAIRGKGEVLRLALTCLLARGHLLIEDVPGVGKTLLAKALARSLNCSFHRIQFTPDLLPSDLIGTSIFHQPTAEFIFKPGPLFSQVVLADEINRAPPKVQSALLEAMQERQVTVDGVTYPLPRPFLVIATENPVEQEGTYPLPEAELDRILFRVILGYPSEEAEVEILRTHGSQLPNAPATSPLTADRLITQRDRALQLKIGDDVLHYVASVVRWTRSDPRVLIGASPRAGVQFVRAAKASALLDGRDFVTPDDVKSLAFWILNHRLLLHPEVITQQYTAGRSGLETVLREIVGDGLSKSTVPR